MQLKDFVKLRNIFLRLCSPEGMQVVHQMWHMVKALCMTRPLLLVTLRGKDIFDLCHML